MSGSGSAPCGACYPSLGPPASLRGPRKSPPHSLKTSERSASARSNMPPRTPSAQTIREIITLHALTRLSYRQLSRLSDVSKTTVGKYLSAFERSSLSLRKARRLSDKELHALLSPTSVRPPSRRQRTLIGLLPAIHQRLSDATTSLLDQWKLYKRQYP